MPIQPATRICSNKELTIYGIMVPVTHLVEKITKGKELQNILARQRAETENSCLPGN